MVARFMSKMAKARHRLALVAAALALSVAGLAWAGAPVSLRPDLSSGATITLGDLFDAPGPAATVLVGYGAPAGQEAVLDAGQVQRIARLHGLDWDNPEDVRRILVRSNGGQTSGRMIDALTYARNIGAGEILQAQDLTYAKVPSFSAPQDMPRDPESLIGKMVRRPLRAGAAAAEHDVEAAQVIKRDDTVQVVYRNDGVSLTLEGKAMASATTGEPVAVLNTVSKKVIQAVAVGPDEAVVGPDAEQYRQASLSDPTQFAALH